MDWRAKLIVVAMGLAISIVGCATTVTPDCNEACKAGGEQIHTNACRKIGGEHRCVYICKADNECDPKWYGGCKTKADDGTLICTDRPVEEIDAAADR
jgi:hypothetical protein